jgi:curli production assembly/transport component CsgE
LAFIILSNSIVLGQNDTSKVDSTQIIKKQTETHLQNVLEEAITTLQNQQNHFDDLEISELIVNSVISKPGNDFFDYFTAAFSWPEVEGDFIILISEKPSRTNTTQIVVMVNDLVVYQNFLQPRASYLQEHAEYAQEMTINYILNYQQIMRDLEGDDRSGSGIY